MHLNEYQHKAHIFACYNDPNYPFFALGEETGEVLGKIAKSLRGDKELVPEEVAKELGDVLWCLQECAANLGFSLEKIASMNLKKLTDRKERDVIKGDGDDR